MKRLCIAMPIAAAFALIVAGCNKELPTTQANHSRNKDSISETNLNFHFVEEWVRAATPTSTVRKSAIGFTIGSKGYMGGGEGYTPSILYRPVATLSDFWQYDPSTNTWTQMANLLTPIERAATFVIGTQGYVGTGFSFNSNGSNLYNQLYQYDQASNTWTQKASLPAGARCDAVGTSINNEGYVGTGDPLNGAFFQDWWQYDPPTDHWTQMANMPGTWGRAEASAFSIGPYGFVMGGSIFATTAFANDLWLYIPSPWNLWVQKASLPAMGRTYATGFNYGSFGALTCGENWSGNAPLYLNDFWYYDMNANVWHSDLSMGGGARAKAVGFAINGTPYVGTGETVPYNYNSDFWYLTYVLQ